MYLISIYFDNNSNQILQNYINDVALDTDNKFMLDNNVPPHITIGAFNTQNEAEAIEIFNHIATDFTSGKIDWVTIGSFKQSVIYTAPVLNEYLHNLCVKTYEKLQGKAGVVVDKKYMPFNWLPHATIGKTLSAEQCKTAYEILSEKFSVFQSDVVSIGLARTKPFENLKFRTKPK